MMRGTQPGYIVAHYRAILAAALLLLIVKGAPAGYDPAVAGFAAKRLWRTLSGSLQLISALLVE